MADIQDTTPRDENPNSIHLETTLHNDHPVTVARDAQGRVAYPSYVPQGTTSPTPQASQPQSSTPDVNHQSPRKATTEPPPSSLSSSRPKTRQWDSEKPPKKNRRIMTRAGTTLSGLNPHNRSTPRRHHDGADTWSSSDDSSSSSSDEEEGDNDKKDHYRRFSVGNQNYSTKGKVSKRDGRLSISVKDMSNTGYLAKALGMAVKKVIPTAPEGETGRAEQARPSVVSTLAAPEADTLPCPKLNIVIMVIGSRGDAQPFLKIGKVLKETYGHRVRIATHPAFREFVEKDSGLEFFSVGGDPSELMAFMVKNPGMIPSLESVKAGDIGRRRAAMAEMFGGFWRACINATDDERDVRNVKMMGQKDPFVADAIIANPPSFAHIHCAEALGIPLHLMFTFPYTPTQAFPHPLASIKKTNVDPGYTNFISYPLVEMMVWQGLGDLVNDFRVKTLGLDPVSTLWAPGATYRLKVPFTYLWSPGLVPKPADWGSEIDIAGFTFLDLASTFKPPDDLAKFLDGSKEPPVYIGFGSIVVDDANRFTQMIFEAVKKAGVRALVSKGWGGLGGDSLDVPENIFMLDNTPHDWLFPKVRACVIHGGAGTTAIALKCGKPTMIVPFFGDQHFWGSMVANVKAGPEPVPYKELTADKLAEGIKYCLTEEATRGAREIARDIEAEGDGAENACRAFHNNLALTGKNSMRCSVLEDRVAVWQLKDTSLRLSPMAAKFAVDKGYLSWKKLRLLRHNEWNDFEGPGEPVTGAAGSLMGTLGGVFGGVGGVPLRISRNAEKRKEKKERRRKKQERRRMEKGKGKEVNPTGPAENRSEGSRVPTNTDITDHADKTKEAGSSTEADKKDDNNRQGGQSQEDDDEQGRFTAIKTTTSETPAFPRRDTQLTASTTGVPDNPAEDIAQEVGRGTYKSASALVRAPVDLSVALAQGFHNAPRLYGDDTVRRPTRVTGIQSGLRAAKNEFVYGIYDGVTGVVRLPVRGARDNGVPGFVRGVGMGVTGFVLKDISALIGPVAYTLKGVVKELGTNQDKEVKAKIRRARIVQGQREIEALKDDEVRRKEALVVEGLDVIRRLWDILEASEKGRTVNSKHEAIDSKKGYGPFKGRKGTRHKRRGLGPAFGSVRTAKEALAALEKNPDLKLEDVLGDDIGRNGRDGDLGKSRVGDAKKEASEKKKAEKEDRQRGEKKSHKLWRRIKGGKAHKENAGAKSDETEKAIVTENGVPVTSTSRESEDPKGKSSSANGGVVLANGNMHEGKGIPEVPASKARKEEEAGEKSD
ncbi:hypothetical protein V8F20_011973 [Naviculisporaceae sp. PSN 640]